MNSDNISWPRGRLEIIAAVFVIVVITINAFMAMATVKKLSNDHNSIANTTDVIIRLKDLQYAVVAADSGKRGYLLTDQNDFLEPYNDALVNLDKQIQSVSEITTEIPGQREKINRLLGLVAAKIDEVKKVVDLAKNKHDRTAMKIVMNTEGRAIYEDIVLLFEDIEAAEYQLLDKLKIDLAKAHTESYILFFSFFGISVVLLVGLLLMQRQIKSKDSQYRAQLEQRAEQLESEVAERTQKLVMYSNELSRSNQELEDFAFVASHDLQEPLRKIRAFSDRLSTLYAKSLDEKGIDYLARMQRAASRMSSLIEDLLEFSRIKTRGKEFVEVDLNALVAAVIDDLEVSIEETNAKVTCANLPIIFADPSQMTQLFINILSNALKFRKPDEDPVVTIESATESIQEDEGEVQFHVIKVQDNGVGFDPSFSEKIFMPFQRLHSRDQYKGNGIGLAVCKRIAERHGGEIIVESEPGKGSIFCIKLLALSKAKAITDEELLKSA